MNLDSSFVGFFVSWFKSRPGLKQGILRNTCLHLSRGVARNQGAADDTRGSQRGGPDLTVGRGPHFEYTTQTDFEAHFITYPGAPHEILI